ncbi:hypothetical protein RvY_04813 [Ramazzottius varieornatus]|uniref:STAS domain-containing protein n=1 Tax=Ramazzottius varieornatus TaxID=947166 RepID=A0A1D1V220_RAMVA|nr:hypothetical protein RvY_04813 [Ramazzottius varieornatus]
MGQPEEIVEVHEETPWGLLETSLRSRWRTKLKKNRCSKDCVKRSVISIVPALGWLANYDIKKHLVGDFISGCTVAILSIPQGMGYGVLAGADAIHGLYASFYPLLIYSLLCTSRHVSVGVASVVSLMGGSIVQSLGTEFYTMGPSVGNFGLNSTLESANHTAPHDIPLHFRVQITMAVTLAVGVWQLLLGVFRAGYLAVFLSDYVIKGFTCAAAFHVCSYQLTLILGLRNVRQKNGPLKLIYFYYDLFSQLHSTHVPTLVFSLVCITVLLLARIFITQNPKVTKRLKIPFPTELIVIMVATLVSYLMDLENTYNIKIIKHIPTGLPIPQPPLQSLIPKVFFRSFALAVISSSVVISLGKIFATKHQYKIDANQELIACGTANIFGSFFHCVPASAGLSRSAVQEAAGGSTQLVSLISASIMLTVLLLFGKYLEPLPRACLGAVIMVALLNMLMSVTEVRRFWRVSLVDASIFLVSLCATLFLDMDIGLAVAVFYSLVVFAFRMQYAKVEEIGRVRNTTDRFLSVKKPTVERIPRLKIFRLYGPLYSGNAESFAMKIRKSVSNSSVSTKESPLVLCGKALPEAAPLAQTDGDLEDTILSAGYDETLTSELGEGIPEAKSPNGFLVHAKQGTSVVVIDCSAVSFVDVVGTENLKFLAKDCAKNNLTLAFSGCSDDVRNTLRFSGVVPRSGDEVLSENLSTTVRHFTEKEQPGA